MAETSADPTWKLEDYAWDHHRLKAVPKAASARNASASNSASDAEVPDAPRSEPGLSPKNAVGADTAAAASAGIKEDTSVRARDDTASRSTRMLGARKYYSKSAMTQGVPSREMEEDLGDVPILATTTAKDHDKGVCQVTGCGKSLAKLKAYHQVGSGTAGGTVAAHCVRIVCILYFVVKAFDSSFFFMMRSDTRSASTTIRSTASSAAACASASASSAGASSESSLARACLLTRMAGTDKAFRMILTTIRWLAAC